MPAQKTAASVEKKMERCLLMAAAIWYRNVDKDKDGRGVLPFVYGDHVEETGKVAFALIATKLYDELPDED